MESNTEGRTGSNAPESSRRLATNKLICSAEWGDADRESRWIVLTIDEGKIADMQACASHASGEAVRPARSLEDPYSSESSSAFNCSIACFVSPSNDSGPAPSGIPIGSPDGAITSKLR